MAQVAAASQQQVFVQENLLAIPHGIPYHSMGIPPNASRLSWGSGPQPFLGLSLRWTLTVALVTVLHLLGWTYSDP